MTKGSVKMSTVRRSRARTPEDKQRVRLALIEAGRYLFASSTLDEVSIRKIAERAGYTPATIYQYFPNKHALFTAIREEDVTNALAKIKEIAASSNDPAERVKAVFLGTANYWAENFQHYQLLFEQPISEHPVLSSEGVVFGQSSFTKKSRELYQLIVKEYLDSVGNTELTPKFASDCLIAATHGMLAFPMHTATMGWSTSNDMIDETIAALLDRWA